jgi:hypothetical protein
MSAQRPGQADERFDADLRAVLLERTAQGVPEALRARMAAIPVSAPTGASVPLRRRLLGLAATIAALAVIGAALVATLGFHGALLIGPAPSPSPTASAAVASSVPASAQPMEVPPFPSVPPDAPTTSGRFDVGQVAVMSDAQGPAVLVRVRDVTQVAAVPGLEPRMTGDVFLSATIDYRVLHVPGGTFAGIGYVGWKTFGATMLDPAAGWPTPALEWVTDLRPGMTLSGRLGWEAPPSGEVTIRLQESATAYVELVLRAAPTTPVPTASPSGWPVTLDLSAGTSAAFGPDGSVYLAGNGSGPNAPEERGTAYRLDASGRLVAGWPVTLPFAGWVDATALGADGTYYVAGAGTIAAYAPDGQARPGWPVALPGGGGGAAQQLRVGTDGTLYAEYASSGGGIHVAVLASDGTLRSSPVTIPLPRDGMIADVILAPDGTLFVAARSMTSWRDNLHGALYAVGAAGRMQAGWPVAGWDELSVAPDGTVYAWRQTANAKGDAVASTQVAALTAAGRPLPGWPITIAGAASPAAVSSDGIAYLTVGAPGAASGSVLALDRSGRRVPGWPAALPGGMTGLSAGLMGDLPSPQAPVLAPSGRLFVSGQDAPHRLVAAFGPDGHALAGWPFVLPDTMSFGNEAPFAMPGPPPASARVGADGTVFFWTMVAGPESSGGVLRVGPDGTAARGWPQILPDHAAVSYVGPMPDGGAVVVGVALAADYSAVTVVSRYAADGSGGPLSR